MPFLPKALRHSPFSNFHSSKLDIFQDERTWMACIKRSTLSKLEASDNLAALASCSPTFVDTVFLRTHIPSHDFLLMLRASPFTSAPFTKNGCLCDILHQSFPHRISHFTCFTLSRSIQPAIALHMALFPCAHRRKRPKVTIGQGTYHF